MRSSAARACSSVALPFRARMVTNVSLNKFGHQRIHCTAAGRDVVKEIRTLSLLIERFLNRSHPAPMRRMRFSSFFSSIVCAIKEYSPKNNAERTLQGYPGGYPRLWGMSPPAIKI